MRSRVLSSPAADTNEPTLLDDGVGQLESVAQILRSQDEALAAIQEAIQSARIQADAGVEETDLEELREACIPKRAVPGPFFNVYATRC